MQLKDTHPYETPRDYVRLQDGVAASESRGPSPDPPG